MQSGVINKIWTKTVNTKYGEKPVTLFSLDGDDKIFNMQFGKQAIEEGDKVTFNYDGPKYGEYQVDKQTLKVESKGNEVMSTEAPASAAPSAGSSSGGGGSNKGGGYSRGTFPLEFNDGQRSILRQHAFTQASEIYRHEMSNELENSNISSEEVIDKIIELAYKIERYSSGDDLREEMNNE